ncbi:(2Fe-2S)-binding protein [Paenibacillus sp. y28]|uniref:(2Fe-2S)-binding protein n=1 Tax=Paenibacillus sp. y28 TaxID=3129110 RepID=UPI0030195D94
MALIPIDSSYLEQHLLFSQQEKSGLLIQVTLEELLHGEAMERFLAAYTARLRAADPDVAATYFISYYTMVCGAFHYLLWHNEILPDLSPSNLGVQLFLNGEYPGLVFNLQTPQGDPAPHQTQQRAWLEKRLAVFYSTIVRAVVERSAAAGGIRASHLWGQVAARLAFLRDKWKKEPMTERQQEALSAGYELLLELPGSVFGTARNPLNRKFRYIEDPRNPGEQVRIRASCCMAYKTGFGHGYCYTCPKLTGEQREMRKQELYGVR